MKGEKRKREEEEKERENNNGLSHSPSPSFSLSLPLGRSSGVSERTGGPTALAHCSAEGDRGSAAKGLRERVSGKTAPLCNGHFSTL